MNPAGDAQELASGWLVEAPDYLVAHRPATRTATARELAPRDKVTDADRKRGCLDSASSHTPLRPSCPLRRVSACPGGSRSTEQGPDRDGHETRGRSWALLRPGLS